MRFSRQTKQNLLGYLFIAPNLLGFMVFLLLPVLFSLVISFTSWDIISGIKGINFVGFKNYLNLYKDDFFVKSLLNNLFYTSIFVPVTMVVALFFALLMNGKIFGAKAVRTMVFIPFIINIVAASVIWMIMFQPEYGPINSFLLSLGVNNPPHWLADKDYAMVSIIIVNIWMNIGYTMIIYLAGIQSIPKVLYEAALIDGADGIKKFFKITLPMLSPTTFFILIITLIHSFKIFGTINVMTEGGPGDATTVIVYDIFITAFRYYKMGYASAMAWILFIVIFIITLIQWKGQKKWVNYSL